MGSLSRGPGELLPRLEFMNVPLVVPQSLLVLLQLLHLLELLSLHQLLLSDGLELLLHLKFLLDVILHSLGKFLLFLDFLQVKVPLLVDELFLVLENFFVASSVLLLHHF